MKKILLGVLIGLLISLPAGVFAWSQNQKATPVFGADCNGPYKLDDDGYIQTDDNGHKVYDPKGTNARCSVTIYRFTDQGNTCYVVKGTNAGGIDCVTQ